MGAVNYFTSDYITLGIKPYETEDYSRDADFMQFIRDEWGVALTSSRISLIAAPIALTVSL